MDDALRERFKPRDNSLHAIQAAMLTLHHEQVASARELAELQAARHELERDGKAALARRKLTEQNAVEARIRELEAAGEELDRAWDAALRVAAGEAAIAQVSEAQAAIAQYNSWLARHYEKAARAIADGVALERAALAHIAALRNFNVASAALAPLSQVYVGREARNLSSLCRLPAVQPGQPIFWGM